MKTHLLLALTLFVMATQTFAADGFDRTGAAAAISRYDTADTATLASDDHDRANPDTVAADGSDHTGSARTD
ncbi:hypothetical protein [Pseudomonas uvaldensis]|uniref:hypothetical protein n=1 Tax=Pseudomonas uvaldensis TaxID=2878385 RepID=UPI001E57326E|nr:hypothetical protein [Pseudomonas uvaldensis]MCE0461823.1 hypothetical protein [Pseudomonas uvaldensis]